MKFREVGGTSGGFKEHTAPGRIIKWLLLAGWLLKGA